MRSDRQRLASLGAQTVRGGLKMHAAASLRSAAYHPVPVSHHAQHDSKPHAPWHCALARVRIGSASLRSAYELGYRETTRERLASLGAYSCCSYFRVTSCRTLIFHPSNPRHHRLLPFRMAAIPAWRCAPSDYAFDPTKRFPRHRQAMPSVTRNHKSAHPAFAVRSTFDL